jgi:hypothetical protein
MGRSNIALGAKLHLTTSLGDIDVLGEIAGGGSFDALLHTTVDIQLFGKTYRALTLEALIRAKRAAGRPKDLEVIAELEAIREERERPTR